MRNPALDIMKGLGILLVVFDHTEMIPLEIRKVTMSFLMPMFFMVGGYLYRQREDIVADVRKAAQRLLLPYFIWSTAFAVYAYGILHTLCVRDAFLIVLGAAGVTQYSCLYLNHWPSIGALWFLPAMFWCRVVYNLVFTRARYPFLSVGILSLLGLSSLQYLIHLPLGISEGLSAMLFYVIGHAWACWRKQHPEPIRWWACLPLVLCWVISFRYSMVITSAALYNHLIINVLGACGATWLFYHLSAFLSVHTRYLGRLLVWCGEYSLILLLVHWIEIWICGNPSVRICHYAAGVLLFRWLIYIAVTYAYVWIKSVVFRKK